MTDPTEPIDEAEPVADLIANTISDLVVNFLYYDRKEDEDLPVGAIEDAVESGEVSVDGMVETFRAELTKGLSHD